MGSLVSNSDAGARVAFQYRDFRLFQAARALTIIGTEAQSVAVAWQVYQITHRALDLGFVGLAQFLPGILLSIAAGHAADRYDRRKLLMACFCGFAFCSLALTLVSLHGGRDVAPIYAVLVLLGVVRAFSGPTGQALMPQLVSAEHFGNAVAWGGSIFQISTVLGPAIGGLVYGFANATTVYIIAIVMYAGAITALAAMHVRTGRMEHRDISWETVMAGFSYVWRHSLLLGAVTLDLFAVLLGGAVALLPIYANDILHVGPIGLGALRSAPGAGALIMAVALAFFPIRRHAGSVMLCFVSVFGAATIAFGLSRTFVFSLLALVVVGASDMVSMYVRAPLVQLGTPPAMRGRVSAVNMLFIGASNEFGQFESGVTGQWFGAVPAVVLGGIGTIVVVALWAWRFPALRRVDRLDITPEKLAASAGPPAASAAPETA